LWAEALQRNKDKAIEVTDEVNYNRYMKYLRGCQYHFIDEIIDVSLVTYLSSPRNSRAHLPAREAHSRTRRAHFVRFCACSTQGMCRIGRASFVG
jgi:hypothetical protein